MFNNQSLQTVQNQLAHFAAQSNFDAIMSTAFGSRLNRGKLQGLRQQWLSGNFSIIPDVQVLSQGELVGANGAYAASLDKIFLSADFLASASASQVTAVLLEEVGHRIDQWLNNGVDSAGDEGEIFSRLVNGETLSSTVLAGLKSQNDSGVINIGGRLIAVENNATGTNGNDVLNSATNSGITAGNDTINALDGNDTVDGGDGNDYIDLGAGNDYVNISSLGNDTFIGGSGNDYIYGFTGNELYEGGSGNDTLLGYSGKDILYGEGDNDSLDGGEGNDNLYGEAGNDTLDGGAGNDTLEGGVGNDFLYGGAGNDYFGSFGSVDGGNDELHGGSGDDIFWDGDGNSILWGDEGDDFLLGGLGNDTLYGGIGNDTLRGNAGNDNLYGEAGNDALLSFGNDYLSGGAGNDTLYGGAGNETLLGGTGNDTYSISGYGDYNTQVFITISEPSYNFIQPGAENNGIDTLSVERYDSIGVTVAAPSYNINLSLPITQSTGAPATQEIAAGIFLVAPAYSGSFLLRPNSWNEIENLYGGEGNDSLTGNSSNNIIKGNDGNDVIYGGLGNDSLEGGKGNDVILSGDGNDTIRGGDGNDNILGGDGNDEVWGDVGNDFIDGGAGVNVLLGGAGNDTIYGDNVDGGADDDIIYGSGDNNDGLSGGAGNDIIKSRSSLTATDGNDGLYGQDGNDEMTGGRGNDELYGEDGNDTLTGSQGNNLLVGGNNDDVYQINADSDVGIHSIRELSNSATNGNGLVTGIDRLDFSSTSLTAVNVNLSIAALQTVAAGVQVNGSSLNTITYLEAIENLSGGGGSDTLTGNDLNNFIKGNSGDDQIGGGIGNDSLDGGAGNNTLDGGAGDDFYVIDADIAGYNAIQDILGRNAVDFRDSTAAVSVNLALNLAPQTVTAGVQVLLPTSVQDVYGGAGNDILRGNGANNQLNGSGGNDILIGNAGFDGLYGGDGNDALYGGADGNNLFGGLGNDVYYIDADTDIGIQTISESTVGGLDRLDFGQSSTAVNVNLNVEANQTIATGVVLSAIKVFGVPINTIINVENLYGGTGNDTLAGNALNNYIYGNAGDDTLYGSIGDDSLLGGLGNDSLVGGVGNNYLVGGVGNDNLYGDAGYDLIGIDADTDFGIDTISGGIGIDTIDFRTTTTQAINIDLSITGIQTVVSGVQVYLTDVEYAYGGSLDDHLIGNSSNNTLFGSAGNDTLKGAQGLDYLIGGTGVDTFVFAGASLTGVNTVANALGRDAIADFAVGTDKIALSKATFTALTSLLGNAIGAADFAVVDNDTLVGVSAAAIVYSKGSGELFYNADRATVFRSPITGLVLNQGLGFSGGSLAGLGAQLALTNNDFSIVA
jgi:Ca2+-binding RTX toxin-like protein